MTDQNAITKYLSEPQKLAEYIRQTGDIETGFDFCHFVNELKNRIDNTLDPVIPAMQEVFERDHPKDYKGMTFFQAMQMRTPLDATTIQRHVRVSKMLEEVPQEFRPRIEQMEFKSKMYIVGLVEDDINVTKDEWNKIVEQPTYQGVGAAVRDVRGLAPRSQLCYFKFDDDGTIWVLTAQGLLQYAKRVEYENEETRELMDWVHGKALRKLGATPR